MSDISLAVRRPGVLRAWLDDARVRPPLKYWLGAVALGSVGVIIGTLAGLRWAGCYVMSVGCTLLSIFLVGGSMYLRGKVRERQATNEQEET